MRPATVKKKLRLLLLGLAAISFQTLIQSHLQSAAGQSLLSVPPAAWGDFSPLGEEEYRKLLKGQGNGAEETGLADEAAETPGRAPAKPAVVPDWSTESEAADEGGPFDDDSPPRAIGGQPAAEPLAGPGADGGPGQPAGPELPGEGGDSRELAQPEPPDGQGPIDPMDGWSGNADGAAAAQDPTLGELFALVEEGRGHRAYPLLLERHQLELDRAALRGEDLAAFDRRYLIALLRAGQELASPEAVERVARQFTENFPDDEQFPLAFFYLTEALYLQDKPLEDSFFFDEEARQALPAWMQTRFLQMKAVSLLVEGDALGAAEALLEERNAWGTLRETPPGEVVEALERVENPERLEEFFQAHENEEWLRPYRPFLMARALINRGELSKALIALDRAQREQSDLSPEQIKEFHAARAEIEKRVLTTPGRIGVLLPLGSTSATLRQLAFDVLDGLRMAVQFTGAATDAPRTRVARRVAQDLPPPFESRANAPTTYRPLAPELVVRDTANSPKLAAKLVEELVLEEKVFAIIGPIARSESGEAAKRADALGVPLISLSLTMEIPPDARFVFRHSKKQEEEVNDLVRYAMDYRGARRFALLFPDTRYGRRISQLFWDVVVRRGGTVVGVESYRPGLGTAARSGEVVGFKELFERLTGMNRPLEPDELALLEELDEEKPDPIVDFDALFIPVGPNGSQELRLIAPYPVTVDAEKVLLLGTRFWNSDGVLVAGRGKLDGSVFLDAYDRRGRGRAARAFRRRHLTMFGHRAGYASPSFFTALAYDTLGMVMGLLEEPQNRTPLALAQALAGMKPYPGVTGLTTFLESGEGVKESIFFTIQDDRIRRVEPGR